MVPFWEYCLRVVSMAILILLTTVGNLLVIHAIFRIRKFRRASHGLVLNLFISDTMVGITVMPIYFINLIENENLYNIPMCYLTALLKTCAMLYSLHSLSLLCIERFFMFKFPIKHRKMFSPSVWPFVLIVITLSLSIPFFILINFEVVYFPRQHLCWFKMEKLSFASAFLILLFGVPALALVFSTLAIIKAIKEWKGIGKKDVVHSAPGGESNGTKNNASRRKHRSYLIVVLMVFIFLFCYIPNMITFICDLTNYCQISERLTVGSKFLHFSKSILNTVIYGLLNPEVFQNLFVTKKFGGQQQQQ